MQIFFFFFLLLSLTATISAQIIPVDSTRTSVLDATSGIKIIEIATPNINNISNNTYSQFNIAAAGVILNNSSITSTSQLTGGNITGNSNITTGSEASLILNQVTSNNTSLLAGIVEVVGTKAGVIIANPNGITCNGCGFINASQVDIITGTSNFSADLLTGFNIHNTGELVVKGEGFLDDDKVDYLNMVSRYHRIQAQVIAGIKLQILSGNNTYNHSNNIIDSVVGGSLEAYAIDITQDANLKSNSIIIKSTEADLGINGKKSNIISLLEGIEIEAERGIILNNMYSNQNISLRSIDTVTLDGNITANNNFSIENSSKIIINKNFNVSASIIAITTDSFINEGNITANNLVLSTNSWLNTSAVIHANNFTIETIEFTNDNNSDIDATNFDVTTSNFINLQSNISADNFSVTGTNNFYNQNNSTISANNLTIETIEFSNKNNSNITTTNDFNVQAENTFSNDDYSTIEASNFNVLLNGAIGFFNNNDYSIIIADHFDITETNRFYNQNGSTIEANIFTTTTNSFYNYSTINIINSLNLIASDSVFNDSGAIINANTASLNITAEDWFFNDKATIDAGSLNITVGDLFFNNEATINAGILNVTSHSFANLSNSTINADSFSVITNNFYNIDATTIDNAPVIRTNNLHITLYNKAINSGNISSDIYNEAINSGNISSDTLSFTVSNDFYYENDTFSGYSFNNLNITTSNDFYNYAGINVDKLTIVAKDNFYNTATGDITANNSDIIVTNNFGNFGHIYSTGLSIIAGNDFINHINSSIGSDNFNLTLYNEFTANGNISSDKLDLKIYNSFTYNDRISLHLNVNNISITVTENFFNESNIDIKNQMFTANNFYNQVNATISADTFTAITTNNFYNYTSISADTFTATTTNNFYNYASISANNFYLTAVDDFINRNNAYISTHNFVLITKNFVNEDADIITDNFTNKTNNSFENYNGATIIANSSNIVVENDFFNGDGAISIDSFNVSAGEFDNRDEATIIANSSNITVENNFYNRYGGTISIDSFNVSADEFYNRYDATIIANSSNITVENDFYNRDRVTISIDNFNVSAGDFYNRDEATIIANSSNITVENDFYNINGIIYANNLTLSAKGDFDYVNDFLDNGTIDFTSLNLEVGGNFSYNNSSANFDWNANESLTVLGVASIVANNLYNDGNITTDILNVRLNNNFINNASGNITSRICNIGYIGSYTDNGNIKCDIISNIIPDGQTLTDVIYTPSGVNIVNIAAPNANGLSNNTYTRFDVLTSGVILNNSHYGGISQLNGNISANPNYTTEEGITISPANIILNQVTSIESSLLVGLLEIVGSVSDVAVIIANHNGIICSGCSFINTSRLDLVTGSNYNPNIGSFIDITTADITLRGNGLGISGIDTINIQVGNDFLLTSDLSVQENISIEASSYTQIGASIEVINNNGFLDIQINGEASLDVNSSIQSEQLFFKTGGNFYNQANISTTQATFDIDGDFNNGFYLNEVNYSGGDISANHLNISSNSFSGTDSSGDKNIHANTFALSVAGDLDYGSIYENIDVSSLNFRVDGDFIYNTNNNFVWDANDSLTVLGTAFVTTGNYSNFGEIIANKLLLHITGDFDYAKDFHNTRSIITSDLIFEVDGNFLLMGDLYVQGNTVIKSESYTQSGATVDNVNGAFSVQVTGEASLDANSSIKSNQQTTIQAENFYNQGMISSNNLAVITASNFFNRDGATVSADNFAAIIKSNLDNSGDIQTINLGFDIENNFFNKGNINANSLTISADGLYNTNSMVSNSLSITSRKIDNSGDIIADDLVIITKDDFNNKTNIKSNSLYVVTNGDFANNINSNIEIQDAAKIIVENNFFNYGNISSISLNIQSFPAFNNFSFGDISVSLLDISTDIFSNTGSISASIFDISTDTFSDTGDITADFFNGTVQ